MNHSTIKALMQEAMRDLDLGDLERAAKGCDYCAMQLRRLDEFRKSAMLERRATPAPREEPTNE